jgi:hypothetical protein
MLLEQLRGVTFPPAALSRIRQVVAEQHGDTRRAEAQAAVTRARNRLVAIDEMRLELKARRAGGEIDANRYAEDDARYRTMQHDAELQMFQAQRVLSSAGDIDQVIGLLTDLGKSIDRLTPELKRKALQGLFREKTINTAGEIVRLIPQAWISSAFGELVWAWRHAHPAREAADIPNVTPTGLEPAFGISPQSQWLLERIAA